MPAAAVPSLSLACSASQGWVVGAYLVGDAAADTAVCVAADAVGWRAPGQGGFSEQALDRR